MTALALQSPALWLPERKRFRLPKFEPWRLLRPVQMAIEGQLAPKRTLQGGELSEPFSAVLSPFSLTYVSTATDASALTTYNFSQSFGAVASGSDTRYLIAAIASVVSGSNRSCSSVSIGGVSATIVVQSANIPCVIAIAAVPTGTSGTVSVTFSGAMGYAACSVYRMINPSSSTADASASDNKKTTLIGDLTINSGGKAVGASINRNAATTISWTGLTSDAGASLGDGYYGMASGGSAGAPATARCNGTTTQSGLATASWH